VQNEYIVIFTKFWKKIKTSSNYLTLLHSNTTNCVFVVPQTVRPFYADPAHDPWLDFFFVKIKVLKE